MKGIWTFFKNKYVLITIGFLGWVLFFAEYDLLTQYKQRQELVEMNKKIEYLQAEIKNLQSEKEALKHDSATIIRYAREKYFMKAPNEEVFILDTTK